MNFTDFKNKYEEYRCNVFLDELKKNLLKDEEGTSKIYTKEIRVIMGTA